MQLVNRTENKYNQTKLTEREVFDIITETVEISEDQAVDFINNNSNPKEYRDQLQEVLNRYRSSSIKYPNRVKMHVSRFGKPTLWMD